MKILDSQISMQSDHSLEKKQSKEVSLRAWVGDNRPDFENKTTDPPITDTVTLSAKSLQHAATARVSDLEIPIDEATIAEDPKITTIRLIIEHLTGREIRTGHISEFTQAPENQEIPQSNPAPEPEKVGWGLEYDAEESYSEKEQSNFSAKGTITTADGQQIDFTFALSLEREFSQSSSIHIRAGDAKKIDPLVINFAGTAAQLSDTKFAFDLNADGNDEQISALLPGSGFLFLDKDGNGVATDGSELFGPQTNHGFNELAKYDLDQNGWIDENDPIYEALQIWSKDDAGNDYFSSLTDKRIGALYLTPQQTEFSLTNQDNKQNGVIKETSIFLTEDFKIGSVQEINLTV